MSDGSKYKITDIENKLCNFIINGLIQHLL